VIPVSHETTRGFAYDVAGIGNAIVDVISHADDSFLLEQGIPKGSMRLIDAAQAEALYGRMGSGRETSGGSAANTLAGLASLGGRGVFIGKVADDQLGNVFAHDIRAVGVRFETAPLVGGAATARCLILVTPDAERSMNTFLGASIALGPGDIDPEVIAASGITYLEGYLWDPPQAKEAFVKAAGVARARSRRVALSLSDSFCVERHREGFLGLIEGHVDILFANEQELISLFQAPDIFSAVHAARSRVPLAVVTRGGKGAVIVTPERSIEVPVEPVSRVVDTTGAGDLYAAGFLFGLARGLELEICGGLGALAAAEIISHVGARPETVLADLVVKRHPDWV
jgi:sugar/nucleoside kinase (ribokinase family)